MANIIIGYKNRCLDTGVTFTPSSEVAGFDADNLGIAHPSEYWRIGSLTSAANVVIDFGQPTAFDLVAPLYTTSASHGNMLPRTSDLAEYSAGTIDEGWTYTNIDSVAQEEVVSTTLLVPSVEVTADSTSGNHRVSRSITRPQNLGSFRFSCYVKAGGGSTLKALMRLEGNSSSDYGEIEINPGSATLNATNRGGNFISAAGYGESIGSGWNRYTLFVVADQDTNLTAILGLLDSSYNDSHTTAEALVFAGPMIVAPASQAAETLTYVKTADSGSGHWYMATGSGFVNVSSFKSMSASHDSLAHGAARSWVHADYYEPATADVAVTNANHQIKLFFHDHQHLTTFNGATVALDVSAVYVGPVWQPTVNVANGWTIRPAAGSPSVGRAYGGQEYRPQISEPRELTLRLAYESPADAFAEAAAMGVKVGQHSPILVIIDPDEDEYGQEQMIYGTLTDLRIGHMGWFSDRGDGVAGQRYEINMKVRELLP